MHKGYHNTLFNHSNGATSGYGTLKQGDGLVFATPLQYSTALFDTQTHTRVIHASNGHWSRGAETLVSITV